MAKKRAAKKPTSKPAAQETPANATEEKRRPGRPPGAGNRDYSDVVRVYRAQCPRCMAAEVRVVRQLPSTQTAATPEGEACSRVDRHHCICEQCGQGFTRMTYVREG